MVWLDDDTIDKTTTIPGKTGVYDSNKPGEHILEGIEVKIYKAYYNKKTNEKLERTGPVTCYTSESTWNSTYKVNWTNGLYTDSNGKYKVYLLPPGKDLNTSNADVVAAYEVEFYYNGQLYEPTEFLVGSNTTIKNTDTISSRRKNFQSALDNNTISQYSKSSYATEAEESRKAFDEKFKIVSGGNAMSSSGTTKGYATGTDGNVITLNYTSTYNEDAQRRISELQTENSNGKFKSEYKMSANTSAYGLYALPSTYVIKGSTSNIELGSKTYYYVNNLLQNLNLGLIARDQADLGITKELYKATVVVNEQMIDYTDYDTLHSANPISLDVQKYLKNEVDYYLGLYASDYYYRSNMYYKNEESKESEESKVTKEIIQSIKSGTELRAFATYKIVVYNDSANVRGEVKSIKDYYDSSFTLISSDKTMKIIDENGNRADKTVAETSYYRIVPAGTVPTYSYNRKDDKATYSPKANGNISWGSEATSSGYKYRKSNDFSNNEVILNPGERLEIFVTYEIDNSGYNTAKNQDPGSERTNLLGEKKGIAEIAKYSTHYNRKRVYTAQYSVGDISGKIDKDSAPDNIVIGNKNLWEDDTADSPSFTVNVENVAADRKITGTVWEDLEKNTINYNQKVANGSIDTNKNENGIKGINVTLVEKIKDDNTGIEFEYVWPDNAFGDAIPNYTSKAVTNGTGDYTLKDFVSGIYVVRFEYGNNVDTIKAGYNGQDYKNTAYQSNKNTATLNNEEHDLRDTSLINTRVSDARDYEPQRLRVMAYSRTISNLNGEILALPDKIKKLETDIGTGKFNVFKQRVEDSNYVFSNTDEYKKLGEQTRELINATRMEANTGKLHIDIEQPNKTTVGTNDNTPNIKTDQSGNYLIKNIDFGLEKRSETNIEVKKRVTELTLTKLDDNEEIFKVIIDPDTGEIDTENSNLTDGELLSIAQDENLGAQGLRYITIEDSYLTNLSVSIKYRIQVYNKSEVDWVGRDISQLYTPQQIIDKAYYIEGNGSDAGSYVLGTGIIYGKYVGLNYYTNKCYDGSSGLSEGQYTVSGAKYYPDVIVKTTVDQVIDYIDNSTGIDETTMENQNSAWDLAKNEQDLDGLISDDSYTVINENNGTKALVDNKNVPYITSNKSNIAISSNDKIGKIGDIVVESYDKDENGTLKLKEGNNRLIISTTSYIIPNSNPNSSKSIVFHTNNNKNPLLTVELVPEDYKNNGHPNEQNSGYIDISTLTNVSTGTSAEDLGFNNMSEILVYSNTVGRRDPEILPGNANEIAKEYGPWYAGYSSLEINPETNERKETNSKGIKPEADTDVSEFVSLTEPTGIGYEYPKEPEVLVNNTQSGQVNIYIVILIGVVILIQIGTVITTIVIAKRKK